MQIDINKVQIEQSWKEALKDEFLAPYFGEIKANLLKAKASFTVYPPSNLIFNAFNLTPFNDVKVVILGQDPYHGAGQAMGLSFSVPDGIRVPPSLANIYKEIYDDLGIRQPNSGDLTYWAKQGVLLLNTSLSVNAGQANSHSNFGWQIFTDAVIKTLSKERENIVFLLWGNPAKAKIPLINTNKHLVLTAAHPSPLARGAFFGCKHFSQTNKYLLANSLAPIDWDLNNG
ncbi:uracil-DNA glycosylase [Campylobacter sp. RM9344]|uniref:Uracil-DNA glycosylase n=1 Tax=Campylobacter californiensis TaxID=1032243 RepID=A0AAW3ZYA0_9BACT|nr:MULTISPECIES: uracil-DNA glycosylase [unclassified Campylobacter]MBE2984955.1 uracil-DNA glycosylase [Campylobacter sp. RM6883]MBE2986698.1 uracil-DNA glycosylase [Campylobacter sp. RM12919]MBE2988785.1 uracil-DNA glycosylase [Campylobacter sp. RM12920]MBE2995397.1 uracil-DNA glycosylase [Campylobacter sp. RM6913]MBE3022862.1 uracil-DNA glycosylase [Campylobacter sp. 7477a]MBE3029968.1 uracil-DNA glycosylase [Campylobacter sp. RM9344]